MKIRYIWQLVLLFCVFSQPLYSQSAQKIRFNNIRKSEDLSNNYVNGLLRDNLGFLWIATNDGLCRYDGPNQIEIFRVDEKKNTLRSNNIRSIFEDSQQNIWIGTRLGGLTRYHRTSGTWKTFQHDKYQDNSISNDEILTITEDSQQRLWIGTENGLNLFDYETENFTRFLADDTDVYSLNTQSVLDIFEDDKGWIWVGTWGGGLHLLLADGKGKEKLGKFRQFIPSSNQSSTNLWKIYQDNQDRYWLGTHGGGLFLMQLPLNASNILTKQDWDPLFHNYLTDTFAENNLSNNAIQDIFEDKEGKLWIGTVYGLNTVTKENLLDLKKETITTVRPKLKFNKFYFDAQDIYSIAGNNILDIIEDEQGLMWFATTNGISQYNWHACQFDTYKIFEDGKKSTYSNNIYIAEDGILWIGGGEYGLIQYDESNDKQSNLMDLHPEIFTGDYIVSILGADNNKMYAATKKGVSVFNTKTFEFKKFPLPTKIREEILDFWVNFMFVDSREYIWLSTAEGLFRINQKTGNYKHYHREPLNPYSLTDNSINEIIEDELGNLWIGTYNGLNKVAAADIETFKCTRFQHCLLYTSPSPRDATLSRMPSSA